MMWGGHNIAGRTLFVRGITTEGIMVSGVGTWRGNGFKRNTFGGLGVRGSFGSES